MLILRAQGAPGPPRAPGRIDVQLPAERAAIADAEGEHPIEINVRDRRPLLLSQRLNRHQDQQQAGQELCPLHRAPPITNGSPSSIEICSSPPCVVSS